MAKPGSEDFPPVEFMWHNGALWEKRQHTLYYMSLGIAPTPKTTLQCFLYHIGHGLVMQYPIIDILAFSWRNRNSFFEDNWADEPPAMLEIIKVKPKIKRIRRRVL